MKDVMQDGAARGFSQHAGKAVAGSAGILVLIAAVIAAWKVFSPEITSGVNAANQLATNSRDIQSLKDFVDQSKQQVLDELQIDIRIENDIALLKQRAEKIEELSLLEKQLESEVAQLTDTVGDLMQALERAEVIIQENMQWRVNQEKRATQRIKDHAVRDSRLQSLESHDMNQDIVINQMRDIHIKEDHEIDPVIFQTYAPVPTD